MKSGFGMIHSSVGFVTRRKKKQQGRTWKKQQFDVDPASGMGTGKTKEFFCDI